MKLNNYSYLAGRIEMNKHVTVIVNVTANYVGMRIPTPCI